MTEHTPTTTDFSDVWTRLMTFIKAVELKFGHATSTSLARLESWQLRWAGRRLTPTGVDATITVVTHEPIPVLETELGNAGWRVTSTELLATDTYRLHAQARPAHGKPAEVARHAATQLRLTLTGHQIVSLRVVGLTDQRHDFYRWGITFTKAATNDDRLAGREALKAEYFAGSEGGARAQLRGLLRNVGVPDSAWRMVPANAAAAAAHPHLKAVTAGLQVAVLMFAAGAVAVLAGSLPAAGFYFRIDNGAVEFTGWTFAVVAVAASCSIAFFISAALRQRKGYAANWNDVALVLGMTFLPLILASGSLSLVLNGWTFPLYLATVALLCVLIAIGRPLALTARFSRHRTARNVLISVTAVIIILNLPASMFLLGAGLPNLLGSIPIGTLIVSGWPVLLLSAAATFTVYLAVRSFRRSPGLSNGLTFWFYLTVIAACTAVIFLTTAYSRGHALVEGASYSEEWAYGLQAVCVSEPTPADIGSYWLVGSTGRTSYLMPRFVSGQILTSAVTVDSNQKLTFTQPDTPCP